MTALVNAVTQLVFSALAPVAARTATLTGAAFDLLDYEGQARITLHGVRTAGSLTPTIEESADGSTGWAAVPASSLSTALTAVTSGTDFIQSVNLDVSITKRHIRLVGTAASSPDHTYGATIAGVKKFRSS